MLFKQMQYFVMVVKYNSFTEAAEIADKNQQRIRIGYLNRYSGPELMQAVASFTKQFPDIDIEMSGGNHEQLYDLLRFGEADLLISDQRRAFSEECVNFPVFTGYCYVELYRQLPFC